MKAASVMLAGILEFAHWLKSEVRCIALLPLLVALVGCGDRADEHSYQGVMLEDNTLYVSARRWKTQGLEQLTQQAGQVRLQSATPMLEAIRGDGEITLFIHGYHASGATVATYFAGLIKQLRSAASDSTQFIVFDWPSIARHWAELSSIERTTFTLDTDHPTRRWEIMQYLADGEMAKSIGADALLSILDTLGTVRSKRRVNILAHSMGCFLVAKAMQKRPQSFTGVGKVIWLAPDLEDDALEDKALAPGLARIGRLDVFFSREDEVLKYLSGIINFSLMLGSHGPAKSGTLPNNVVAHDLTQALGRDGVHNRYLENSSVAVSVIVQALSASVEEKDR